MLKKFLPFLAVTPLFSLALAAHAQTAAKPIPFPFKPDPPLTIDGNLSDWNAVPHAIKLDTKQHVTSGNELWKGPQDISAIVHLAWREETLYVAAEVTDSVLRQTERSLNLWKGDHIELYVDTAPDTEPDKNVFGPRQFQIGLSPGNFIHTGDALTDIAPEAYAFLPAGAAVTGTQVSAKRTGNGYIIEAAIPWTVFDFKPQVGLPLSVEVGVSDTDGLEAWQGKFLTIGTGEWKRQRKNLLPAVLANADGSAPASITSTPIFETNSLQHDESKTVTFDAPAVPEGYEAVLSLQARLDMPVVSGFTPALQVTLNGKKLDAKRMLNKSASETLQNGTIINLVGGYSFKVPYAPDFEATDKSAYGSLQGGVKAALFEFDVTDLLQPTGNTLTIRNAALPVVDKTLIVGNAKLLYRIPPVAKVLFGPPSGVLPVIAPKAVPPTSYQIGTANGETSLQFNGNSYKVASQYSTPDGKWVSDSNKYFSVQRKLEKKGEWIVVHDTFTNLTNENLPLMHRNEVQIKPEKVWLGGLSPRSVTGTATNPHNPTVFGIQGKTGIGLLPLDDVFQVHITNYSTADGIGLLDQNLVLKPKSTYTAEWAIVPMASADNFDFINATRRLLDVNYQLDGSFAFLRFDQSIIGKWSDQQVKNFANYKDAKYLSGTNTIPPGYKGVATQGTALQRIDRTAWKESIAHRRHLLPDAKQLAYFHCFLDVTDEAPELFKDARMLTPDGELANYAKLPFNLFLPTTDNSFGPAVAKNIDIILDEVKLDGVFWDEIDYSRYFYDYNPNKWDGVSADIDPKTMKITRLKSSVTLLSQEWRLQQAQRIMKDHVLIGNGGLPDTRTMRNLHYVGVNETGSISMCVNSQLFTPIALGDHLTERSEEDAYHTMLRTLDYGCVYYWYNDMNVIPSYHTLTRYMFPITPVELHAGYIIGKERIITNRSGVFGWSDNSKHEVHVFDNSGREVNLENIKAPTVIKTFVKDGKTWTEIRIGEDWSAAILRK